MSSIQSPSRLDRTSLQHGTRSLSVLDPDLAKVTKLHGPPPLWDRRPGFDTLIRIILEQQVSLASGRAIYCRVKKALGEISATSVDRRGVDGLRALGVTRQKSAYCVEAARRVRAGVLDLDGLADATDAEARSHLLQVRGIGPWTADVYMLMALGRPDVWPAGDVALLTALHVLKSLPATPTADESALLAAPWAPWRSVAARILWHGYLKGTLARTGGRHHVPRSRE